MELNLVLERFAQRSPLPVMARAVLKRCLNAQELDTWFEQVAQAQYTRSLLLLSVYGLMTQVVLRQSGSVRAAWLADEGKAGVVAGGAVRQAQRAGATERSFALRA